MHEGGGVLLDEAPDGRSHACGLRGLPHTAQPEGQRKVHGLLRTELAQHVEQRGGGVEGRGLERPPQPCLKHLGHEPSRALRDIRREAEGVHLLP